MWREGDKMRERHAEMSSEVSMTELYHHICPNSSLVVALKCSWITQWLK